VRRSVRVDDGAAHEIRVVLAKDELAGVLVDAVGNVEEAEERSAEQTRDIGVIHKIAWVALA
jgi:hypothetical protein